MFYLRSSIVHSINSAAIYVLFREAHLHSILADGSILMALCMWLQHIYIYIVVYNRKCMCCACDYSSLAMYSNPLFTSQNSLDSYHDIPHDLMLAANVARHYCTVDKYNIVLKRHYCTINNYKNNLAAL